LQAVVRQRTRLVNQLHQLLARTYPELATLVQDVSADWVLELLTRYPTARLLAGATAVDLQAVPYLPHAWTHQHAWMRYRERCALRDAESQPKTPSSRMTGLDILRYICSDSFGVL
jgi:hypothetical protein